MQQRQLGKPGSLEFDEQALNLRIAQVTQGREAALEAPPPLFEGSTRGYALQQNELGQAIVELDARPSDCIALAVAHQKPIFVTQQLFQQAEDMSEVLERINKSGTEPE